GIFHLYTHAFFKALLFLGSGAVIHALAGEQDLRNMGGLKKALPITYWTFLIGAIAIAGVPPLAGFFSKDEILWRTFSGGHTVLWTIGMVTAFLTATYMFRLVFLTFFGERHGHDHGHGEHLHDAPPAMALVLIVLAIGSIVAGFVGIPHALGGGNRIEAFLEPSFEAHAQAPDNPEFQVGQGTPGTPRLEGRVERAHEADTQTELLLMGVSTGVAIAGIVLASYFWLRNRAAATRVARSAAPVYTLLLNKYYVDEIYDALIVQPIKGVSTLVL